MVWMVSHIFYFILFKEIVIYFFFLKANPLPLTHLCRRVIRQKIGKSDINKVNKLELPNAIKNFLLYK